MPKFDLDVSSEAVANSSIAEGYGVWEGDPPPDGVYKGVLKVARFVAMSATSKTPGAPRVSIGVTLAGNTGDKAKFNGYFANGGVNVVDSGLDYVNQWLRAIANSDKEYEKLKAAFYDGPGTDQDEMPCHITDFGGLKINSPNGTTPITVTLQTKPYTNTAVSPPVTTFNTRIEGFVKADGQKSASGGASTGAPSKPVEAETVALDDDDDDQGSVFDLDGDADE